MQAQDDAQGNAAGCPGTWISLEWLHGSWSLEIVKECGEGGGRGEGEGEECIRWLLPTSCLSQFTLHPTSQNSSAILGCVPCRSTQHSEMPHPCQVRLHLNLKMVASGFSHNGSHGAHLSTVRG